ncbi:MAG: hypothetical protein HRU01_21885 [Myxococcales bacterium]|nr:hypothetical protein [Myxococcales bacterium]
MADGRAEEQAARRAANLRLGVGVACVCVAAAILYANRMFYHDDAFITLRYARNFLAGDGLVWNPGEAVQGYTNFLFLLGVGAVASLGVGLVAASQLLGMAAWLGLVGVMLTLARRGPLSSGTHPLGMLASVLVVTSAPLIVWSVGGLEGTLFALLVTLAAATFAAAVLSDLSPARLAASGAWFALASLTRPEGAIFFAVSLAFLLAFARVERFRRLAAFAIPFAALTLPYLAWQLFTYGDLVPNTFYVKASGFSLERAARGLRYLWRYIGAPPYLVPALLAAAVAAARSGKLDRVSAYFIATTGVYLAYVVYVGGDHMHSARLVLPVVPLLALALQRLIVSLLPRFGFPLAAAAYAVVLVLSALQLGVRPLSPAAEDNASRVGRIVGAHIAEAWPAGSLVALNSAGAVPFYGEGHRYIDMLGLNDRHIARTPIGARITHWQAVPGHAKGDGDYVLSREPDYIIVGPAQGTTIETPWFLSEVQMLGDPRFRANYRRRSVTLDTDGSTTKGEGLHFTWYEQRKSTSSR